MADIEERIIIAVAEPSLLEGGADKIYPCITKQEAIEVMAKAIRNWEFPYSPRQIGWEDLSEDTKNDYKNMAQSALDALLEGVKK